MPHHPADRPPRMTEGAAEAFLAPRTPCSHCGRKTRCKEFRHTEARAVRELGFSLFTTRLCLPCFDAWRGGVKTRVATEAAQTEKEAA